MANDEGRAIEAVTTVSNDRLLLATTGVSSWDLPRAAAVVGGATWVVAVLQFAAAHVVTASAWDPPYSWLHNHSSNLANTQCGIFAVPNGSPGYVCSPLHELMNGSFVLTGMLVIVGAILLWRVWPSSRLTDTALLLLIVMALGKILMGLTPENANIGLHLMGSLNVPLGSIAVLLLSVVISHGHPALSIAGIVLAVMGLVGTVLSTLGEYVGPALYLGIGVGGMERLAACPAPVWLLAAGVVTVVRGIGTAGSSIIISPGRPAAQY